MTTESMDTRRATFHAMTEGSAEDWSVIAHHNLTFAAGLPDRVLREVLATPRRSLYMRDDGAVMESAPSEG